MQNKTMFQLLSLSILIAIVSVYGPYFIFSNFLLQTQFIVVFIATLSLLSFFAFIAISLSNTLKELFAKNAYEHESSIPQLSSSMSIIQLFSFYNAFNQFIKSHYQSQKKLIDHYNKTTNELKSHIEINEKFLKFVQHSIAGQNDENIHIIIQREILEIIDSFHASSFYATDSCGDLLRLDSSEGFETDDFLLKTVPHNDFMSPLKATDSTIRIIEKIPYSQVTHFVNNSGQNNELFNIIELPIYVENHLYGIFFFYNKDINQTFSPQLKLLLDAYSAQAINAITNKILIKKTVFLSKYDSLTGLHNRSYFEQYFEDYNKKALRYNERYSLVLIDLNRLKTINDKFGHIAGDKALQEFANIFKNNIRETDVLARFGGDEFIAIFHNSSLEQTQERLQKIHEKFAKHYIRYGSFNIPIRFSYGVSAAPDESMILNILVKIADERMYQLKDQLHKKEKDDFDF